MYSSTYLCFPIDRLYMKTTSIQRINRSCQLPFPLCTVLFDYVSVHIKCCFHILRGDVQAGRRNCTSVVCSRHFLTVNYGVMNTCLASIAGTGRRVYPVILKSEAKRAAQFSVFLITAPAAPHPEPYSNITGGMEITNKYL